MNCHRVCRAIVFAFIGSSIWTAVEAQKMYRCGNTYQDRPCELGENKVVGHSNATVPVAKSGADTECTRRGEEAQKIVWAREAGVTEEKMQSEARDSARQKLISDVYRNRGSAPVVKAAIEADCMAEKERAAQAADLINAANKLLKQNQPPTDGAGSGRQAEAPPIARAPTAAESDEAGNKKEKARCEALQRRLDDVRRKQRAGGSAADMDELNERFRDLNSQIFSSGCSKR